MDGQRSNHHSKKSVSTSKSISHEYSDLLSYFQRQAVFDPDTNLTEETNLAEHAQDIHGPPLQKWRRVRQLGKGLSEGVWLEIKESKHGSPERRAVKVVSKSSPYSSKPIRYHEELIALCQLSKYRTSFVNLHGWFESETNITIITEYIALGDLEHYLKEPLSEPAAKTIAFQLVKAVQILHGQNWVHRDLKLCNVYVVRETPDWHVKIGDFGLSKRLDGANSSTETIVGTPNYAAPEITGDYGVSKSGGSSGYTPVVDMWSLGCMVYYLLTLRVPFPSRADLKAYCLPNSTFPYEALSGVSLSSEGLDFIQRLLQADPRKRSSSSEAAVHRWFLDPEIGHSKPAPLGLPSSGLPAMDQRTARGSNTTLASTVPRSPIDSRPGILRNIGRRIKKSVRSPAGSTHKKISEPEYALAAAESFRTSPAGKSVRETTPPDTTWNSSTSNTPNGFPKNGIDFGHFGDLEDENKSSSREDSWDLKGMLASDNDLSTKTTSDQAALGNPSLVQEMLDAGDASSRYLINPDTQDAVYTKDSSAQPGPTKENNQKQTQESVESVHTATDQKHAENGGDDGDLKGTKSAGNTSKTTSEGNSSKTIKPSKNVVPQSRKRTKIDRPEKPSSSRTDAGPRTMRTNTSAYTRKSVKSQHPDVLADLVPRERRPYRNGPPLPMPLVTYNRWTGVPQWQYTDSSHTYYTNDRPEAPRSSRREKQRGTRKTPHAKTEKESSNKDNEAVPDPGVSAYVESGSGSPSEVNAGAEAEHLDIGNDTNPQAPAWPGQDGPGGFQSMGHSSNPYPGYSVDPNWTHVHQPHDYNYNLPRAQGNLPSWQQGFQPPSNYPVFQAPLNGSIPLYGSQSLYNGSYTPYNTAYATHPPQWQYIPRHQCFDTMPARKDDALEKEVRELRNLMLDIKHSQDHQADELKVPEPKHNVLAEQEMLIANQMAEATARVKELKSEADGVAQAVKARMEMESELAAEMRAEMRARDEATLRHLNELQEKLDATRTNIAHPANSTAARGGASVGTGQSDEQQATHTNPDIGAEDNFIVFEDCRGQKFRFVFQQCRTFQKMHECISSAFEDSNGLDYYVNDRQYEVLDSDNFIIIPEHWEGIVKPGSYYYMRIYPFPGSESFEGLRIARARRFTTDAQPYPPPGPHPWARHYNHVATGRVEEIFSVDNRSFHDMAYENYATAATDDRDSDYETCSSDGESVNGKENDGQNRASQKILTVRDDSQVDVVRSSSEEDDSDIDDEDANEDERMREEFVKQSLNIPQPDSLSRIKSIWNAMRGLPQEHVLEQVRERMSGEFERMREEAESQLHEELDNLDDT